MSATFNLALRGGLAAGGAAVLLLSFTRDWPALRALLPPLLAALVLAPKLASGRAAAWWKLLAVCVVIAPVALWPLYGRLLPALTTAGVACWFAVSLRAGSTPLIERMARVLYDDPARDGVRAYRRLWTGVWAAWLAAVAAGLAGVAVLWPGPAGMAGMLVLLPAAVIGLLALEFFIRRRRFHPDEFSSFAEFLRALAGLRWEQLRR